MTDHVDLREQLAAFLAGELDGPAAEAVQDRIATEPWVATMADDMADLMVELGGIDEVHPPAGYPDRLRAGLSQAIGHSLPESSRPGPRALTASGAAAATGWAEHDRPRREEPDVSTTGTSPRRDRLNRSLAVAAAVVLVAVASVGVLATGGVFSGSDESADTGFADADQDAGLAQEDGDDADVSAMATEEEAAQGGAVGGDTQEEATEQEAAEEAEALEAPGRTVTEETDSADDSAAADAGDAGDDAQGETTASADPAVVDDGEDDASDTDPAGLDGPVVLALGAVEDQDLRTRVAEDPAVQSLLGADADRAGELARSYSDEILRGGTYPDGTAAGTCLREVLDAAGPGLVPAVAAQVDLPDGPAIAFALVRSAGEEVLDTVDVWVVAPEDCTVRRVVS